jgi:HEXXH motif-containing protein
MATVNQDDLHAEIASVGINPMATRYLAKIYYRQLVGRAAGVPAGGGESSRDNVACHSVDWLHPRVIWAVTAGGDDGAVSPLLDSVGAGTHGDMTAQDSVPPTVEYLPGADAEPWVRQSVQMLQQDINRVDSSQRLALSAPLARASCAVVDQATTILCRIWPEAGDEFRTLVRAIVYVEGTAFKSATIESAFGAIYASNASLGSVPAAVEMLLHETGHHALYLRNFFTRFVTNGSSLAAHPLRKDPRPIAGVVHSAHVLARMATGLARWAGETDAPEEVHERRAAAEQRLSQSLDVLESKAQWTQAGETYFADLKKHANELASMG